MTEHEIELRALLEKSVRLLQRCEGLLPVSSQTGRLKAELRRLVEQAEAAVSDSGQRQAVEITEGILFGNPPPERVKRRPPPPLPPEEPPPVGITVIAGRPHGMPQAGWVYFIQAGVGGPVKIGWSAEDPKQRLRELQAGCAWELAILLLLPASGRRDETALHYQFKRSRIRREWFRLSPDLREFLGSYGVALHPPSDPDPKPDPRAVLPGIGLTPKELGELFRLAQIGQAVEDAGVPAIDGALPS